MIGGYNGRVLFVNLTTGTVDNRELAEDLARNFLGGYGIGAKVLYEMMPAGADPLGEDSVLGFIPGPGPGTKAFFSGRYTIVHKSPITGGWNDANSGGYFGPELKKAGIDAVFFSGISEKPVYLWIHNGEAELRDASHLWGLDSKETWAALKKEVGDDHVRVVAIGPSGERMSLISCPINDGHRAPGRGGGGAVMGSKKLKAIAVRGTMQVPVADPERIIEINRRVAAIVKERPSGFGVYGTGGGTAGAAMSGDSPVKNWGGVGIVDYGEENAKKMAAPNLDKHKIKQYGCFNCPIGCGAEYNVTTGRWPVGLTERPEYETAAAFGSTCLCSDDEALIKINEVCNRTGLDTISSGMTVAWAMECYNNNVLSREELDGIDLTWGNGEAMVAIVQKMADGEGCGAILANGSAYAAKYWGKGSEYLVTASGIELPMHDPRLGPGLARTYQYDPTPGRHVKGGIGMGQMRQPPEKKYNFEGTGEDDLQATSAREILNCLGFCMFSGIGGVSHQVICEYGEAITGMSFSPEDSLRLGLRILNMRQAFNVREGITPADCTIADRAVGKPPLTAGPTAGATIDNDLLGRNFFAAAEWDLKTGKPSLALLKRLGHLDEVIGDLYEEAK